MALRFAPFVAGGYIAPGIGVPSAPTNVVAVAGNGNATVTFDTPPNGGAPITGYTALSSPGGFTGSSATNSISVSGLSNGTPYTFTVTATNTQGTGPASAPSNSVTPVAPTVPVAPTIGTATAGNASASVTFTANGNGGSPITGFTATSAPGGFTGAGASSPLTVPGLANGTTYTFTVKATNAVGNSAASGASNSCTPAAGSSNLTLYANGTLASQFPATTDLSFSATITRNSTTQVCPGSAVSLQVATTSVFGGGWQPGSLWNTIPPNGFDDSQYTQLRFSLYTPNPGSMYVSSHYSRCTGNDIAASTSVTQGSSALVIAANTWSTVTVPLSSVAMLGAKNFYKFAIGSNANTITYYVDNVTWVTGTLGWIFQGTGSPASGWSDASINATADYTWLPGTLNASLYSLNNPSNAASQFTASCSGTTMTVSALISGSINIGDTACWQSNLGGSSAPTILSGTGPYTLSTSQTVSSQAWASAPAQSKMTGCKLTAAVVNGTLKLTNPSVAIGAFTTFTFGVIPTKSGYAYQVQFYDTLGAATGSAVNAGSTYTQHDFGVTTGSFTVYNMPLSAFGTLPATIGGVSIKETSANATNVTYFSAIGFYS
jgi:hypothetical protein